MVTRIQRICGIKGFI